MIGDLCESDAGKEVFPFDQLPIELQYKIMSFLNPPELCRHVALVCKRWKRIAYDPILWLHLEFTGNEVSVPTINALIERSEHLRSLTLYRFSKLWEIAPTLISCGRLKKLTLFLCNGVSAAFLVLLNNCSPLLQVANFEGSDIDDRSVGVIANWKDLHTLNLFNCVSLTDDSVIYLAKNCTKLKHINIDGVVNVTDKAVEVLVEQRKAGLQQLYLDGEQLTDRAYHAIADCKNLTAFSVSFADGMTDSALLSIAELKKLTHLKICRGVDLTNAAIACFFNKKTVTELTFLNLGNCNHLRDEAIEAVASCCTKLKTLELDWCYNIRDTGIKAITNSCKCLKILSLIGLVQITDACLQDHMKNLPKLTFLDLQQCAKIEDDAIIHFVSVNHDVIVLNYYGEKYRHVGFFDREEANAFVCEKS